MSRPRSGRRRGGSDGAPFPTRCLGSAAVSRTDGGSSPQHAEINANRPAAGLPATPDGDGRIVQGVRCLIPMMHRRSRCAGDVSKCHSAQRAGFIGQNVGDEHSKVTFTKPGSFAGTILGAFLQSA